MKSEMETLMQKAIEYDYPEINPDDYELPKGASDAEIVELLKQPLYRICNLYWIKSKETGQPIKFRPNPPQCAVLYAVYIEGKNRLAIPKSRQIGFSTLFAIISLDETHFSKGKQASVVDQTQLDASEKLDKVRYAWVRMPSKLRAAAITDNGRELEFDNNSRVVGGMRARGGTNQVLHISEWGPIAYDEPERSREIISGALPSVSGKTGKVFAESTHKGGKGGDWYDLIKRSIETPERYRTEKDFWVMFFPWWKDATCRTVGDYSQITDETRAYFAELTVRFKRRFDNAQMLFYQKAVIATKAQVFSEYPSTLEESWKAPTPGAIYSVEVDKARASGRISNDVLHYPHFPVYTVFDIGAPLNTKCWIFQVIGDRINLLEALSGSDDCATPAAWVKRLKEKSAYSYGGHFLPHDGETLWKKAMEEAGMSAVVVLDKPIWEWDNINDAVAAFARCYFNAKNCEDGIGALEAFHCKAEPDGNIVRNVPVHDWASHFSTAFGYVHQTIRSGKLVDRSAMPRKPISSQERQILRAHTGHAPSSFTNRNRAVIR